MNSIMSTYINFYHFCGVGDETQGLEHSKHTILPAFCFSLKNIILVKAVSLLLFVY